VIFAHTSSSHFSPPPPPHIHIHIYMYVKSDLWKGGEIIVLRDLLSSLANPERQRWYVNIYIYIPYNLPKFHKDKDKSTKCSTNIKLLKIKMKIKRLSHLICTTYHLYLGNKMYRSASAYYVATLEAAIEHIKAT
jgi:hypothetical protein